MTALVSLMFFVFAAAAAQNFVAGLEAAKSWAVVLADAENARARFRLLVHLFEEVGEALFVGDARARFASR